MGYWFLGDWHPDLTDPVNIELPLVSRSIIPAVDLVEFLDKYPDYDIEPIWNEMQEERIAVRVLAPSLGPTIVFDDLEDLDD